MHEHDNSPSLPDLIAGPILRRVDADSVSVWLVTSKHYPLSLTIADKQTLQPCGGTTTQRMVQIGERAYIQLLTIQLNISLKENHGYNYDVSKGAQAADSIVALPHLQYHQQQLHFYYRPTLSNVLHGSCRKPHFEGKDALVALDAGMQASDSPHNNWPDLLLMTGDQVYTDDVAGPMLQAIHQVSDVLGLYHEKLSGCLVNSSSQLADHPFNYYERELLLPKISANKTVFNLFFEAKKKPIFTSVHAKNHLIALNEMLAMYILVWSPVCWEYVKPDTAAVQAQYRDIFNHELHTLNEFRQGLQAVQRVLAHLPVYMIFDDHDVTDDWNLTRNWEEVVYGHPLSKRVVGNAIAAYWLCQGWGNAPEAFAPLHQEVGENLNLNATAHDKFISDLMQWDEWHFQLATSPPISVMDTRTQRWRSESNGNKPSGLMDWEALCQFQQGIIGHEKVIVVSAAPIYGVKLIETIQRIFTFFGQALTVDAENWMAHNGTANVILNVFRHIKTPPQFIILSGDVHYSFVYDVTLKFRRNSPRIVQFTCSGIKNGFPKKLLAVFDTLNRLLYASRSPLNLFTKRRNMTIKTRQPESSSKYTLVNKCAIGQLIICDKTEQVQCQLLTAEGDTIVFSPSSDQSSK